MYDGLRKVRAGPLTGCEIFCSVRLFLLFGKASPSLLAHKLPKGTAIQRRALLQRQMSLSEIDSFNFQQRVIAPHCQRFRALSFLCGQPFDILFVNKRKKFSSFSIQVAVKFLEHSTLAGLRFVLRARLFRFPLHLLRACAFESFSITVHNLGSV